MRKLFVRYITDLYQDVPTCVYEGLLLVFFLGSVLFLSVKRLKRGWRMSAGLLALEYVILIYCATVVFREYVENVGHSFTPFWSYKAIDNGRDNLLAESVMNVVVFVPVGLLLCCISRRLKWWMVLLIGFSVSFSVEALQFFFHKGFSEVDDIIHNTAGAVIGYGCFALAERLLRKIVGDR